MKHIQSFQPMPSRHKGLKAEDDENTSPPIPSAQFIDQDPRTRRDESEIATMCTCTCNTFDRATTLSR